jgi:hypothetical protein
MLRLRRGKPRTLERMNRATALTLLTMIALLASCRSPEEPTKISPPEGAIDVREVKLTDINAYQTYFTMRVRYPANPALAHYSKVIGQPWIRCDWIPEWQGFVDGTVSPNRTVHQQASVWVNPAARRTLMIASTYQSSANWVGNPESEDQQVVVVEYFDQDIQQIISMLKLRCPKSNAL